MCFYKNRFKLFFIHPPPIGVLSKSTTFLQNNTFWQKMSAYCMCKNATWCLGVGNSEPDRFCSNFVINVLEASDKRVWTNRKLQMFLCRLDWKHETSTVSYTTSDAAPKKETSSVTYTSSDKRSSQNFKCLNSVFLMLHHEDNLWFQMEQIRFLKLIRLRK